MCGIVGAIAQRDVANILLDGLKRLEYRGYDSAGMAVLNGGIHRQRTQGKVCELAHTIEKIPMPGSLGIAHTRWATHGEPVELNAHPHMSGQQVAVVHNGIIENYESLRERLKANNYTFSSDTDTETVAHLIHYYLAKGENFLQAVKSATRELEGAFALGVILEGQAEQLIAVRRGSPLVIGLGEQENFIASDQLALLPVAKQFVYLEDGDIAQIMREKICIMDANGELVERVIHTYDASHDVTSKGAYRHYMLKEIFEQPAAVAQTLEGRLGAERMLQEIFGIKAVEIFPKVKHIQIAACGTSYHAGLIAKHWLETFAGLPCSVDIASEIRYRTVLVPDDSLFISISQSGETADTLAALEQAKTLGFLACLGICNVAHSSLVRSSDLVFMTRAGVEIGVASTKAFTTQLTALLMLTAVLSRVKDSAIEKKLVKQLRNLPQLLEESLALNDEIKALSEVFADKEHALFLGRGSQYPVALEGALKLKEISYIHAEAYPAGELKHGPLALVDKDMPVIAVAPNDTLLEKLKSNLQEVRARGGELYVFADSSAELQSGPGVTIVKMPAVDEVIAPILYTIPLQLLAYHVAVLKGTDVDQPRNLAKSVTVE